MMMVVRRRHATALVVSLGVLLATCGHAREQLLDVPDEADEASGVLPMTSRVTAMEARIVSLEETSGTGRAALKADLDALKAEVETAKGSDVGNLAHTVERVTEVETKMVTLEGRRDTEMASLTAEAETLNDRCVALHKMVGVLAQESVSRAQDVHQRKQDPVAPGGALPVTDRITALESRVITLEETSGTHRAELKAELELVKQEVETMKDSGDGSLLHTMDRVLTAERKLISFQGGLENKAANLQGDLDVLKTKVAMLEKMVSVR